MEIFHAAAKRGYSNAAGLTVVAQVDIRCNAEPVYNRCLVGGGNTAKVAAPKQLPVFHTAAGTSPTAEVADIPYAGRVDHTHTAFGHHFVNFTAERDCPCLQRLHVVDHASSGNRVASGLTALCNRECGVGRNFDLQPIRFFLAVGRRSRVIRRDLRNGVIACVFTVVYIGNKLRRR